LGDVCGESTDKLAKKQCRYEKKQKRPFWGKNGNFLGEMQDKMQDKPCPKSRIMVQVCGHE